MSKRYSILAFLLVLLTAVPFSSMAEASKEKSEDLDVKEIIFEHLLDGYGWEVPFSHTMRIPLPVIVKAEDGRWFCFMSSGLTATRTVVDPATGKKHQELVPVIKRIEKDGKTYEFVIAHVSTHKDKVVQIFPLSVEEEKKVEAKAADIKKASGIDEGDAVVDGYVYVHPYDASTGVLGPGVYFKEYRPLDLSITKDVFALFIAAILVIIMMMSLVRYYSKNGLKAPRKGMGFLEMLVAFVYYDTIKSTLGDKAKKFGPYLLTCFFFILTMNLVGLIVIFPGGANLTGNIAVTLVLAVLTFLMTNLFGTKHYWKEIFWPDVPIWLKFPLPIMQLIEVFGIFTKPAALCVRLFANMMGGHMIVITLTLLIFIFASFGMGVAGGATVISVLFSMFMIALDILVSFIQAYVFTLLSALFIGMAQAHDEEHEIENGTTYDGEVRKEREELSNEKAALSKVAHEIDTVSEIK